MYGMWCYSMLVNGVFISYIGGRSNTSVNYTSIIFILITYNNVVIFYIFLLVVK